MCVPNHPRFYLPVWAKSTTVLFTCVGKTDNGSIYMCVPNQQRFYLPVCYKPTTVLFTCVFQTDNGSIYMCVPNHQFFYLPVWSKPTTFFLPVWSKPTTVLYFYSTSRHTNVSIPGSNVSHTFSNKYQYLQKIKFINNKSLVCLLEFKMFGYSTTV